MASVSPILHWGCPPCNYDFASARLEVDNRLPANQNTTTYSYDSASNLATVTLPNGLQSTFTYDDLNRVTKLDATKANYTYQLDSAGNRKQVTESNGRVVNWTYDGVNRLTNESISLDPMSKNGTATYILDPVGNRTSLTSSIPGIPTASFSYDADDRILSTESYDANGNTLTSGARTFTYDFENRLKSMALNSGPVSVTLQYDGDGNRVAKTVGGVTTRYLVDDVNPTGYAQVVEEIGTGGVQRRYTYGRQRISQTQSGTTSFYGYDGGGSVRQLTDSTGTVTDTYDYDAWGNAVNSTGTTPNVYLYRGEQYDSDLNLYYLRARYFNPLAGRFITKDPFSGDTAYPVSLHRYIYTGDDPVNAIDPTGRNALLEGIYIEVETEPWFIVKAAAIAAANWKVWSCAVAVLVVAEVLIEDRDLAAGAGLVGAEICHAKLHHKPSPPTKPLPPWRPPPLPDPKYPWWPPIKF